MDGATDIFLQQNAAFYVPIAHCPPAAIKQGRATIASRIEVRRMGGSTLNNSIISKSAKFSPMLQPRIEFTAKLVISLYLSPTCREMRYRVIFSRGRHLGGTHRGRASNYHRPPISTGFPSSSCSGTGSDVVPFHSYKVTHATYPRCLWDPRKCCCCCMHGRTRRARFPEFR